MARLGASAADPNCRQPSESFPGGLQKESRRLGIRDQRQDRGQMRKTATRGFCERHPQSARGQASRQGIQQIPLQGRFVLTERTHPVAHKVLKNAVG
jgi:hypothetical protein